MICDKCLHANICGNEGAFEEALTYCADFLGWIPVSERLPEDPENVLIYLSSNQIAIGLYNSHRLPFMDKPTGWGTDAPHDWSSNDVVAWMPLPEPYMLKPCPFCGKEVTLISTSQTKEFIFSHKGLCNCPFYQFKMSWEVAKTLKEATKLWNRRAESEVENGVCRVSD